MIQQYMTQMEGCQSLDELARVTGRTCACFGFPDVVYISDLHVDLRTTEIVQFHQGPQPLHAACLLARQAGADPIGELAEGKSTPVFWTPDQVDMSGHDELRAALAAHGVTLAVTVPLYGIGDEFGTLTVFGTRTPGTDQPHATSLAAPLLFLASVVHENVRRIRQLACRRDGESNGFTARERDFIAYLLAGMSAREIAAHLHRSVASVNFHCGNIYKKPGVDNQRKAIVRLLSIGFDGRHAGNNGWRSV